jgi:hypothetical protein
VEKNPPLDVPATDLPSAEAENSLSSAIAEPAAAAPSSPPVATPGGTETRITPEALNAVKLKKLDPNQPKFEQMDIPEDSGSNEDRQPKKDSWS